MLPYIIIILALIGGLWLFSIENKRMRSRTSEEYERDVADPKLKGTRAALSPFEFLKNKQAQAAHEMRMNERYGHSHVLKKKDVDSDNPGDDDPDEEE